MIQSEDGNNRVHLVGIGGMHMSAIAQLLLADGIKVSGSDLTLTPLTDRLRALGADVRQGHQAENVDDAGLVVTTAAAKPDNAELVEARQRGIPILSRHEMVARLMEGRTGVAIAGAHGKTTTSSLIAVMLKRAGLDPTYLLGGESLDLDGNAGPGEGPHIVVEADEYAGAFLAYHPQFAVVTNVEADHLEYYGTEANLLVAFGQFMANVAKEGVLVVGSDSPLAERILAEGTGTIVARIQRFSVAHEADWWVDSLELKPGDGSTFTVRSRYGQHGYFNTILPGRHNVANALAAIAAGHALGLDEAIMRAALADFRGAHRRFELVGEAHGITIVDDYAHHPTEIRATLEAARVRYPDRRLVALFQPHTYSRTQYLLDGFRSCFAHADRLFLLQTFAARETPDAGFDARQLAHEINSPLPTFVENADEAVAVLNRDLAPGDVCLTIGAGDVTQVGPKLLEALCRE